MIITSWVFPLLLLRELSASEAKGEKRDGRTLAAVGPRGGLDLVCFCCPPPLHPHVSRHAFLCDTQCRFLFFHLCIRWCPQGGPSVPELRQPISPFSNPSHHHAYLVLSFANPICPSSRVQIHCMENPTPLLYALLLSFTARVVYSVGLELRRPGFKSSLDLEDNWGGGYPGDIVITVSHSLNSSATLKALLWSP